MNVPGRKYFHGETVYTDWVPRGGDSLILRAQGFEFGNVVVGDDIELKISVYTKNSETVAAADYDGRPVSDGTSAYLLTLTLNSTTAVDLEEIVIESEDGDNGMTPADPKGLQEMVRLKIEAASTASSPTGNEWIMARIFPPIFYDNAIA